jgi:hypothetical protein
MLDLLVRSASCINGARIPEALVVSSVICFVGQSFEYCVWSSSLRCLLNIISYDLTLSMQDLFVCYFMDAVEQISLPVSNHEERISSEHARG